MKVVGIRSKYNQALSNKQYEFALALQLRRSPNLELVIYNNRSVFMTEYHSLGR